MSLQKFLACSAGAAVVMFILGACKLLTPEFQPFRTEAEKIACVMLSNELNAQKLADDCGLIVDVVDDLIAQREASKKQGVFWPGADAGVKDANSDR